MKGSLVIVFGLVLTLWPVAESSDSTGNSLVEGDRDLVRVKRIVTKLSPRSLTSNERAVSASVEQSQDLRLQLVSLVAFLNENGGFSSTSEHGKGNTTWTENDVRLAGHLVTTYHILQKSGFRPPRTNKKLPANDDDRLRSFMAACFVTFGQRSNVLSLPNKARNAKRKLTTQEQEEYLRELTSVFFILASGGDVSKFMLPSKSSSDKIHQQQLVAHYTQLLSQADGPKLPFKACGENKEAAVTANQSDWPWMAALMATNPQNLFIRLFCGGVLINEWFVLTAAHCLNDKRASEIIIRLGEYNFRLQNKWRRDYLVERMVLHERFDPKTYDHDIALIKLKEKVIDFDNMAHVWPICLPPPAIQLDNKKAYVAGWGKIAQNGPPSDLLLDAELPIWENNECERLFKLRRDPIEINLQFCAGPKDGSEDACDGDSGGPLMHQMPSGRWAVVGIVSWGIDGKCAVRGVPGVYTRVSSYLNWIYSKISF